MFKRKKRYDYERDKAISPLVPPRPFQPKSIGTGNEASGALVSPTVYDYGISSKYKPPEKDTGFDPDTDYSKIISRAIQSPGNLGTVQSALEARIRKASSDPALTKYINDDIWQAANEYISRQKKLEDKSRRAERTQSELLNKPDFSYNPERDSLYKQYSDIYRREGRRAMEDTLGAVAANTGGLASSYAAGAANQAYNNYAARQADIIPELHKLAYDKYLNEVMNKRADYDMLYGETRDALSDFRYDAELSEDIRRYGEKQGLDRDRFGFDREMKIKDFEREGEWHKEDIENKNREFENKTAAEQFDRAVTLIKLGATNAEIAKRLGISEKEAAEIADAIRRYIYS